MVEEFLLSRHKSDILEIIQDADDKKHFSLNINFVELFENDTELGNKVLKDPEQAFCDLENQIFNAQELLIEQLGNDCSFKLNTHARIYGLPACPELHRTKFPRNADTNLFLQICGTIVRVTASKTLEYKRMYTCKKCKCTEMVEADYDFNYVITAPNECSGCRGNNLISTGELLPNTCKDYQEIKIQEKASEVGVGSIPSALWVTLEDDLVDTCKPGDDVVICGLVKVRHLPLTVGKRIDAEIVLQANHILATNGYSSPKLLTYDIKEKFMQFWEKYGNNPIKGRDVILKSFCPKLYGMHIVKLAAAVVLAGGSRCKDGEELGIRIRAEPHLLLVGDPGTGKSQLLRYAAKVASRAVLTTGIGTTSAGLTAAAMMEDGHWQLEGGALVLADGGICCIDEFNSMKPHDRASIHEAMEQQTISIAKIGRVCKLQTRCAILAATNPKGGRLDPSQPLSLNLSLPTPLLSRFDIVMMLRDKYDEEWDNLVADHILSGKDIADISIGDISWNLETLQQYFIFIKDIHPVQTEVASIILGRYYQAQRMAETRNKARSTVRLLDSLIRLSQAHARLMCHSEVRVMDAVYAVVLIESSMDGECSILLDKLNVTAPLATDSMENYIQLATTVLQKLGLPDILRDEVSEVNNPFENLHTRIQSSQGITEDAFVVNMVGTDTNDEINNYKLNDFDSNNDVRLNETKETGIINSKFKFIKKTKLNKSTELDSNQQSLINNASKSPQDSRICVIENSYVENENASNDIQFDNRNDKKRTVIARCDINTATLPTKKNSKTKAKKTKLHKDTELNTFQMMNLIPSIMDDFDVNILNSENVDDKVNHQNMQDKMLNENTHNNQQYINKRIQENETETKCDTNITVAPTTNENKTKTSKLSKFAFRPRVIEPPKILNVEEKSKMQIVETSISVPEFSVMNVDAHQHCNTLQSTDGYMCHKEMNKDVGTASMLFEDSDVDEDCF